MENRFSFLSPYSLNAPNSIRRITNYFDFSYLFFGSFVNLAQYLNVFSQVESIKLRPEGDHVPREICSNELFYLFQSSVSESPTASRTKTDEKAKRDTPEKPITLDSLPEEILGDVIDEVIKSNTMQPSVPAIVLDTINDIIMTDPGEEEVEDNSASPGGRKTDVEDQEVRLDVGEDADDSKPSTPEEEPKASHKANGQALSLVINGHLADNNVTPTSRLGQGIETSRTRTEAEREPPGKLDLSAPTSAKSQKDVTRPEQGRPPSGADKRMPQTPSTPLTPTPTEDKRGPLYRSKDGRNESENKTSNRAVGILIS